MQLHSTSAFYHHTCVFCKSLIDHGGAVWRSRNPYHAACVVRTLARAEESPTLWHGLLPAGKDRDVRRSNLNNTKSATSQVGGHA